MLKIKLNIGICVETIKIKSQQCEKLGNSTLFNNQVSDESKAHTINLSGKGWEN